MHLIADGVEQVGHGRAEGRASAVAHMQGPGRVGRDEFHLDPPPAAELAASELIAPRQNFLDHRVVGSRRQKKIDKARTRDLDLGDAVGRGQRGDDALGQFAGFAAGGLRQGERHGAGEIAVRPFAGALQRKVGRRGVR